MSLLGFLIFALVVSAIATYDDVYQEWRPYCTGLWKINGIYYYYFKDKQ